MTIELIHNLAADFWDRAGAPASFPVDLRLAVQTTLPVFVVSLPGLCVASVQRWLQRRRAAPLLSLPDRPLHGCIFASAGCSALFVEAGLPPEDDRVVVAHELAHYLAHYEHPRIQAQRRLGPSVLPVLDGLRPPTAAEVLAGTLAGVPLGAHVHYMERDFDPRCVTARDQVERLAADLALELLAPRQRVLEEVQEAGRFPKDPGRWRRLLVERFGLPYSWAAIYAGRLRQQVQQQRTFSEILGL